RGRDRPVGGYPRDRGLGSMAAFARLMPAPGRACWRSARFGGAMRGSTRRGWPDCWIMLRFFKGMVYLLRSVEQGDCQHETGGRPVFGPRMTRTLGPSHPISPAGAYIRTLRATELRDPATMRLGPPLARGVVSVTHPPSSAAPSPSSGVGGR